MNGGLTGNFCGFYAFISLKGNPHQFNDLINVFQTWECIKLTTVAYIKSFRLKCKGLCDILPNKRSTQQCALLKKTWLLERTCQDG